MAEPGALVVPAGAGLVAAPPGGPVLGVAGLPGWRWGEETCDLGDGQWDHPRIGVLQAIGDVFPDHPFVGLK